MEPVSGAQDYVCIDEAIHPGALWSDFIGVPGYESGSLPLGAVDTITFRMSFISLSTVLQRRPTTASHI
jgi:hypothetical protein